MSFRGRAKMDLENDRDNRDRGRPNERFVDRRGSDDRPERRAPDRPPFKVDREKVSCIQKKCFGA